ncbi:MAG: HIT domain-containing protein [Pseudomonadota bacterium]
MKQLWAPWRMDYILSTKDNKTASCIFCNFFQAKTLEENLLLYRDNTICVSMNKFPYINGHLLVIPKNHERNIETLNEETQLKIMKTISKSVEMLKKTLNPEGFNIGCNLEQVAGAGIVDHLHFHIVPRWLGDSNYMCVISETRVISDHIQNTYNILSKEFKKIENI